MNTAKTIEKLEKVADLLEQKGWTREHYAVDENGIPCSQTSPRVAKFCLTGAIDAVYGSDVSIAPWEDIEGYRFAEDAIADQIFKDYGTASTILWNDDYARDRRQVVRLVRRTARNLRRDKL